MKIKKIITKYRVNYVLLRIYRNTTFNLECFNTRHLKIPTNCFSCVFGGEGLPARSEQTSYDHISYQPILKRIHFDISATFLVSSDLDSLTVRHRQRDIKSGIVSKRVAGIEFRFLLLTHPERLLLNLFYL